MKKVLILAILLSLAATVQAEDFVNGRPVAAAQYLQVAPIRLLVPAGSDEYPVIVAVANATLTGVQTICTTGANVTGTLYHCPANAVGTLGSCTAMTNLITTTCGTTMTVTSGADIIHSGIAANEVFWWDWTSTGTATFFFVQPMGTVP